MNETFRPSEPSRATPSEPEHPARRVDESRPSLVRGARFRLGAVIAILAIGGIVAWLALSGNDEGSSTIRNPDATAISVDDLSNLASSLNQPIYWVGADENVKYELVRRSNQILVGYVASDQEVGNAKPHLVVGTYQMSDAYSVTQRAAQQPGTVRISAGEGAVAFYNKSYPLSAFVSFPGSGFQVEVYDPKPGRARELIASGAVTPVPGSPTETSTEAEAVTPKQLARRATDAGQPIYWAGQAERGGTLELTRTGNGWFLVRYLPAGAQLGEKTPHLTVSTYPVKGALAAVDRLAAQDGAQTLDVPDGGVAVVNPSRFPNSVFLAYPGTDYQIEVFAPTLDEAREVVTSGRIAAAG